MATANPKRLYQVWKGRNRFFCGGRLIFGPDMTSLYISMLLIAGPSVAFCSQVITKIHSHEKVEKKEGANAQSQILGFPVLVVAVLVTIADLIFLLLTSSRDPGIIPRNAPPELDEEFNVADPSAEWVYGKIPRLKLPRTKDVFIDGFSIKVKYCDTCFLYRPPRASHCSMCNNCVQKFDHHCPWVGQCIGLRNYRFFFLFISSSTFLCIYVFTFSWLNILGEKRNYHLSVLKSMHGEILSVILIVYTFFSVWFVGGLTIFHLYLISISQTTYENFRCHYDKKASPFNKGILRNFKDALFSKIPPSVNDFRSWVLGDTIEIGSSTSRRRLGIVNRKEQIDIRMVNEPEIGEDTLAPSILQNLDYFSAEDNLEENDRHDEIVFNHFNFADIEGSIAQELRDPNHSYIVEDGIVTDERVAAGSTTHSSSAPIDRDVQMLQSMRFGLKSSDVCIASSLITDSIALEEDPNHATKNKTC